MDSIGVPFENSDRQLVERIQQYQRVIRCQRASARRRIAGLRNHAAHRLVPMELDALQEILEIARARVRRRLQEILEIARARVRRRLQEILEIARARVRRRLTERFNHVRVHHVLRGIRNHEHRQRVQGMVQRAVPFPQRAHRRRPVLSTDQQDHDQQGENVVHEQIARLQGDQDHRQERVGDIANEQTASLDGLQLQDTVGHHPVLPPHAGIE